jgi:hypothetical protein
VSRVRILAGAAVAVAVAVAVAATRHAPHADGSPVDPGGAWQVAWVASVLVALALYGAASLLLRRRPLSLRAAVICAVFIQVAPLAGPLLLSRDVFLYWAEARLVTVHHTNPYVAPPSRYGADPATAEASAQWRTQTEPYGPGWVALGSVPALAAGTSRSEASLLYRVLATLGILAALAVLALRTRSAGAVAFLGWSPLVALHFAGGGHSDAWLALALVVGVAYRGTAAGGAAWPLGASLKGVPVVLLPLELARARLRFPARFWAALVGVGAAVVLAATALFGTRWATASAIGAHGTSPIGGVHYLTELGLRHRYAVVAGALVFLAVYGVLLREAWRRGRARISIAATALCLCSSLLRPWYAVWPVALAAVEEDALAQWLAYGLSVYVVLADAIPV